MEKLLPSLYLHFKNHPESLLARIYGVYKLQMQNYSTVNLLLMGNTLRFAGGKLDLRRIYDLKGSRVKRYVYTEKPLTTTVLKDMNFLEN